MAACSDPTAPRGALDGDQPAFATSAGLRRLLVRLHRAGRGAWREDDEAAALMRFCEQRYGALARKHGLEPADAAAAAFAAMRNPSVRTAEDPWAVVTTGVRITLIAEERANGLLTSARRARRASYSHFHDATRFGEQQGDLTEYHPALAVPAADAAPAAEEEGPPAVVWEAAMALAGWGWPTRATARAVAYVVARLSDIGDRTAAYESLRRDKAMRARLDWPHASWIGLLRILLGHPTQTGPLRHGLLARLLLGDDPAELLTDPDLARTLCEANPTAVPRLCEVVTGHG